MLTTQAPAKINLCLYVGPRRADGYHPVCSLMEKVDFFDRLDVRKTLAGGIRVTGVDVPAEQNTVYRAARALEAETGARLDVEIAIGKEIPAGAGLAGGSSDAAAALKLLVELFSLDVSRERLGELAVGIGADVPFFLAAGPQLATGIGERLEPVPLKLAYSLVIVVPRQGLSTAVVYDRFDQPGAPPGEPATHARRLRDACRRPLSVMDLAALLHNDLEAAAINLCPDIASIREELLAAGAAGALMSGSGTAVFGIFAEEEAATRASTCMSGGDHLVRVARPWRR